MLLAIVDWAAFQKPFDWYARRPILPPQSRLPHQSISQPCRTAPWLNSFQINALNLVGKIGLPSSFGEKTAECCAHAPSRDAGKTLVFRGDYALARAGEPVLLDGECCGKGNREGEALWLLLLNNFMTLFLANLLTGRCGSCPWRNGACAWHGQYRAPAFRPAYGRLERRISNRQFGPVSADVGHPMICSSLNMRRFIRPSPEKQTLPKNGSISAEQVSRDGALALMPDLMRG